MSDDTKIVDQNLPAQASGVQGGTNTTINPQGSMRKEQAPVGGDSSDFLKPSGPEVEHAIDEELRSMSVQETKDRPDLTEDHKQAGINHAGASIPPQTAPTGLIKLPLTEEEALAKVKGKKPNDSGWGLGKLVLKVLKVMGIAGV